MNMVRASGPIRKVGAVGDTAEGAIPHSPTRRPSFLSGGVGANPTIIGANPAFAMSHVFRPLA